MTDKAAERYFRAGEKAYQAQNFEAAAQNFEEAYKAAAAARDRVLRGAGVSPPVSRRCARPSTSSARSSSTQLYLDKVKTGGRVADAADSLGRDAARARSPDQAWASRSRPSSRRSTPSSASSVALGGDVDARTRVREVDETTRHALAGIVVTFDGKRVEPYALINVEPGDPRVHVEAPTATSRSTSQQKVVKGTTNIDRRRARSEAGEGQLDDRSGRADLDRRPADRHDAADALDVPAGPHVVTILHRGREPVARELVVRPRASSCA